MKLDQRVRYQLVFLALLVILLATNCGAVSRLSNTAAEGSLASSSTSSSTLVPASADPYADRIAEFLSTGMPVMVPKWADKFELPYYGPVLTRQGLLENPSQPVRELDAVIPEGKLERRLGQPNRVPSVPGIPWGHPRPPHTGEARHLYILTRTSANSQAWNSAQVEERMFGSNAGHVSPSVSDFYHEMSYGELEISGDCVPKSGSAYLSNHDPGSEFGDFMIDIFDQMLEDGISWTDYDGNNDGYIDGYTIILPYEIRAFVSHFYWNELEEYFGKRMISMGFLGEGDVAPECNTAHHEMGHFYYLPDYYDYGGDSYPPNPGPDGSEGLGCGYWDIMCAGNYTNPPMPLSALNKWILGWLEPTVITVNTQNIVLSPSNLIDNPNEVYLAWTYGTPAGEYFLIENRWLDAIYDTGDGPVPQWKPGKGLLIWHVDDGTWAQRYDTASPTSGPNSFEEHKALDLECADSVQRIGYPGGYDDLDALENPGDAADVWPRGNQEFSFTSAPSSVAYDESDTLVRISNIRKNDTEQTVTIDVEVGAFAPPTVDIITPDASAYLRGPVNVTVSTSGEVERVEYVLYHLGGTLELTSTASPYGTVILSEFLGNQRVRLQATAVSPHGHTASDEITLDAYNLIGDVNADGIVDMLDNDAIESRCGIRDADGSYRIWMDCNGDGIVNEADASAVGYYFGNSL